MSNTYRRILNFACLSYTIISFALNFIIWLSSLKRNQSRMLEIWANIIVFLICLFTCMIIEYKKKKKQINTTFIISFASTCSILYTISSTVTNIAQYILKKENFWNGYTLIILLLFSITTTFSILRIKCSSYIVSALLNFLIVGVFYYIIFVLKAGFHKGNLLISLTVYAIIYVVSAIVYYLITKNSRKELNSNKEYKNLFS